jgi:hypothetical protein
MLAKTVILNVKIDKKPSFEIVKSDKIKIILAKAELRRKIQAFQIH